MKEIVKKVEQWFTDRHIIENSTVLKQLLKTSEEVLELQNAILDNDIEEIKDAIGDIQVTLVGACLFKKLDIHFIYKSVKGIADKESKPLISSFTLEAFLLMLKCNRNDTDEETLSTHIGGCINSLIEISMYYSLTLEECLQSAYNVISKRTGKMINGQFVKDK